MSDKQDLITSTTSGSSAADSPARTSAVQDSAQDSPERAPDSGTSSAASSATCSHVSLSSRTSRAARRAGCARCGPGCKFSDIERAPWGLPPEMSERRTDESESSLWPTPTVCGEYNRAGLSPTSGDGLRTAVLREAGAMWATPAARDEKGPSYRARRETGACLPGQVGESGRMNPAWLETLMGFPDGWTDIDGPLDEDIDSTAGSRRAR